MVRDDGQAFPDVEENCWSPVKRIEECDASGIKVQVLSTVPVMFSYWSKPDDGASVASFLNGHIAEIIGEFPQRFIGLGTVPLQSTEHAIKELEQCRQIGLSGIQIGTNVNQLNLGEPQFFDFFAVCGELGMAVFVHPWEMMGEGDMQKYWLPWLVGMPAEVSRAICSLIFSGVLERLPNLRISFAHGGGSFPATLGRIDHGEEVGYEYGLTWETTDDPGELANYACRCGAPGGRGTMLDPVPLDEKRKPRSGKRGRRAGGRRKGRG